MYFKNDYCNLYFEKFGHSKKNILILPGWGDNRTTFNHIIELLKNKFSIYIIDYPGFGQSTPPTKELTIYDYADMIKEFIFTFNIDNPIIIAHSFGGRISIILSGLYKIKINKMIFIDTAGIKERKNLKQLLNLYLYKLRKNLAHFIKNKKKKEKYLTNLRQKFSSNDYLNLPTNMHNTFKNIVNENLKKYIKHIDVETLILWGEYDLDTPLKSGIIFNKKIKNSALIILPKAGHFSYIEYKELVLNIIDNFLNFNNI